MDISTSVQDEDRMTTLMYAVNNKKFLSIVKRLKKNENNLNIEDKNGDNTLFHAFDNDDILLELIDTNINANNISKEIKFFNTITKESYLLTKIFRN